MAVRHTTINGSQKVWLARVAYQGHRRAKVCRTKDEARHAEGKLLRDLKAEAAREEQEGARPATLKTLFEFYVADLEARGKGADTIVRAVSTAKAVEALAPDLLALPVGRIRDRDVFAFRQARARDAKPATINRDLRTLRAMLKAARPDLRFPGAAFFPEDETRVRWLRPEEELLVLEPMPSPFREMAKLAALTLMRLSEIRTLHREYVHLEQGVLMLPKAKAGARPVILSGEARKILSGQLEALDEAQAAAERESEAAGMVAPPASGYVFPGPDRSPYSRVHVSRVFRKAARAAGLKDFHFHDLRHHGATMALNNGFTAPIVQALGGWKTERMMRRYAAVTDETLRAAAEAVSGNEPWQYARKSAPRQAMLSPSQG
jgi:integrase